MIKWILRKNIKKCIRFYLQTNYVFLTKWEFSLSGGNPLQAQKIFQFASDRKRGFKEELLFVCQCDSVSCWIFLLIWTFIILCVHLLWLFCQFVIEVIIFVFAFKSFDVVNEIKDKTSVGQSTQLINWLFLILAWIKVSKKCIKRSSFDVVSLSAYDIIHKKIALN